MALATLRMSRSASLSHRRSSDKQAVIRHDRALTRSGSGFGPQPNDLDFLEVFAGRMTTGFIDLKRGKAVSSCVCAGEHLLYSACKLYGLAAHGVDEALLPI